MKWYSITLPDEQTGNDRHTILRDAFAHLFTRLGVPPEVGMFAHSVNGKEAYYFSPGAVQIARPLLIAYGAVECEPPQREELSLVFGHSECDNLPFA